MIENRYYGDFGGAYIPEILLATFEELVAAFNDAKADPDFWMVKIHTNESHGIWRLNPI